MRIGHALLVTALLWGASPSPTPAQGLLLRCPKSVSASYGGFDGWSTITVQANFARALLDNSNGRLTCQYGFGPNPEPVFGLQQPCPQGMICLVKGHGFRLLPK